MCLGDSVRCGEEVDKERDCTGLGNGHAIGAVVLGQKTQLACNKFIHVIQTLQNLGSSTDNMSNLWLGKFYEWISKVTCKRK